MVERVNDLIDAIRDPRPRGKVPRWLTPFRFRSGSVRAGLSQSDFEAVLASGVFDPAFYLKAYPDIGQAGVDPLLHYLGTGRFEKRKASETFDPAAYVEANPEVANSGIEPFLHYVLVGRAAGAPLSRVEAFCRIAINFDSFEELKRSELSSQYLIESAQANDFFENVRTIENSGLFDRQFYRSHVPSLDKRTDPIAHYMIWGHRSFLDPSPDFSTAEYCLLNADVREAGCCPLLHYILNGKREQRPLCISERDKKIIRIYSIPVGSKPAEEHAALERMKGAAYLCRYGFSLEKNSSLKYAVHAVSDLVLRTPLFSMDTRSPDVSIIIPVHGQLQVLLNCLDSLVAQTSRYRVEIIIVDDASPPESQVEKVSAIPWIRYVKQDSNKGFLASCNHGASCARGRYFVFLNNDTRLSHDWLDELIRSFEAFPKAGLVGSKLLNDDLSLQEAGGIIWRDGTPWNFGRGDYAWRPEYCFARQVDYCSGASIAVLAEAWRQVSGFDEFYAPAYCEDADLAFQLRRAGYEIWLQPLSLVIHYEGRSHGRDVASGIKSYQVANLEKFYLRWCDVLSQHGAPGNFPNRESNRTKRQHILIIDAQTPIPDRDAGSVITYQVMRLFLHLGWHVSFLPRNFSFLGEYTNALQRMGVEVLVEPCTTKLDDLYKTGQNFYDVIFAFRVPVLWDWYENLRKNFPNARIIFHDIDLHYLRMQRKAELLSDSSLRVEAEVVHDRELELFAKVDCSIVVTETEKAFVESEIPLDNIIVYPYTIDIRRSQHSYDERIHVCFIGGYTHDPNVDAVVYFVREIWPRVKPKLRPDAKFFIVGPDAPESVRRLASESIVVTGHLTVLDEMLDDCRLSVAPLRYGAGIKGKLVMSLANGLPSVASSIAVEGMGLMHEKQVLVADDPQDFAAEIVRLYGDRELWHRIQEEGYSFVEEHYSWNAGVDICKRILDTAERTWIARRRAAWQKRLTKIAEKYRTTVGIIK
jgi:GT2 family glycosyltransferase